MTLEPMRDVLRGSLGRSLRELAPEDRLAAAWPVACGSALASRAEISALDEDGMLHIAVAHVEWLQPFVNMRTALQHDLARIAEVPLTAIHFEVKRRVPAPRHPPTAGSRT